MECKQSDMENLVSFNSLHKTYSGKKVLITGSTGFKGSWLSLLLLKLDAKVFGYALAPKHQNDNFNTCQIRSKIKQEIGDIRDRKKLHEFIQGVEPDHIFHLAAQPLVLEGYKNPAYTFETNIIGTVNVFEAARNLSNLKAIVNITSDKCYQNKEWMWGYRENEPMGGDDPYSASKGCSELVTHAYSKSFFENTTVGVASARAGNVIGGGDWSEDRIIPDIFRSIEKNKKITLRNPKATRPWQFVLEPLFGYLQLGALLSEDNLKYSGAWNFGPSNNAERTVLELVHTILTILNKDKSLIEYAESPFHEANFLKLDSTKALTQLGWSAKLNFSETIKFTTKGYQDELKGKNLFYLRMNQIEDYLKLIEYV